MDFKVSYLDAGLTNTYFSDSELGGTQPAATQPQRVNRRYKTQLRDFLSTCRTKRKLAAATTTGHNATAPPPPQAPQEYIVPDVYPNINVYPAPYPTPSHTDPYTTEFHQTLYDNTRFISTPDNLFHQYRPLAPYYTEYPTAGYVSNGFFEVSPQTVKPECDKLYRQVTVPVPEPKYDTRVYPTAICEPASPVTKKTPKDPSPPCNGPIKVEAGYERQTVLMWGRTQGQDPLKSLAEMNSEVKWKPETPPPAPSPKYHYPYPTEHGQEVWPQHQIYSYHQWVFTLFNTPVELAIVLCLVMFSFLYYI